MEIIKTAGLTKNFKRFKKQAGMIGSIKGLIRREYEEKQAVGNLDLTIQEGEFVGLIGPNGAGKTTLVKMLTGIIAPSSGSVSVLGYYPNDLEHEFKQQYAVVIGQKSQLFFELTVEDTLRLFKEIYGLPEEEYKSSRDYFVKLFQVQDLMHVQVRTLSLGERMKMELIAALLHNPKIIFLDEPTIGLDAIASKQIRGFLAEINESRGTTIILTSHYMEDIKALCKRSIVINHGSKIYDGDTEKLFERFQKFKKITFTFSEPTLLPNLELEARILEQTPYKKVIMVPKENAAGLLRELMNLLPTDIAVEEEEIGTIVERIYQEGGDGLA
ncbi:ABC transporter ATP-binding protein [Lacrimispora xylanisolvens]|uniref:ABC transporter ATP-binding protein n=1 Tax=Lacrimispora xylanisolvens TaxID=384636 RepID=UPI002402672A|nr:ATP-binding cassette domain-containing protein [Paenibacillaceae bacterium]